MFIEKKLREELRQAAESMSCPPELQDRIQQSYRDRVRNYNNTGKGSYFMKKRILAGIISLAVLIPSGLFAASYLADDLFGSSAVIEERGGTAEDYLVIEEGLQEFKSKLSADEFEDFMALMKQMVALKLKMTDEGGVRYLDRLTKEEQMQFQELSEKLNPYFEKVQ